MWHYKSLATLMWYYSLKFKSIDAMTRNPKKVDKDVISVINIVTRRNILCLSVRLNQSVGGTIDSMIHVTSRNISNLFPQKSMTHCSQRL